MTTQTLSPAAGFDLRDDELIARGMSLEDRIRQVEQLHAELMAPARGSVILPRQWDRLEA